MIQAGIKEIKNNLSRYIAKVKDGQVVMITERGKPVARIIKENSTNLNIRLALAPLVEKGLVQMPTGSLRKIDVTPYTIGGKSVSDMVIEDRR